MKKYLKEILMLAIQLSMFYIFPLYMYLFEPIGMVLIILLTTFILSGIISVISKNKIKYLYPVITSISFIPTIFIYYNSSASIHAIWYLVVSIIGMIIGKIIDIIINLLTKKGK